MTYGISTCGDEYGISTCGDEYGISKCGDDIWYFDNVKKIRFIIILQVKKRKRKNRFL